MNCLSFCEGMSGKHLIKNINRTPNSKRNTYWRLMKINVLQWEYKHMFFAALIAQWRKVIL